jgi:myo-inositol 2-dehydrogenase/D-chiro-inositol 1-dehydrogenase
MTEPIRVGILGLGRIGRMHADLLAHQVPGTSVTAVADTDPATLRSVTERLHVRGSADPMDVIGAPDVDAVAICSPTPTHVDLVIAAAAAGKPMLCEKPISLDLDGTDRALAAVREAGVTLQVGFNRRFDPGHAAVAGAVAGGEIGAPELVRISSRDPSPPPIDYLAVSGGIFVDQTIHDFDMARYVTGSEVVSVSAAGAVRVDPQIAEVGDMDTVAITLRHAGGCLTQIDNSRRAVYGFDQRVEVFGSDGVAASENQPAHGAVIRSSTGGRSAPLHWFFLERYLPSYVNQWVSFTAAVRDGVKPAVTGDDARAALVIARAAAESVRTGRAIEIGGQ